MSDFTLEGVVTVCSSKEYNDRSKGDPFTLYSFQLEGEKRWFKLGKNNKWPFAEGDTIKFTFDTGTSKVDLDTIEKIEAPKAKAPAPKKKSGGGKQQEDWGARAQYWDEKEQRDIAREQRQINTIEPRITWAASHDRAIKTVEIALQHDLLGFGNAAKGKRLGMLMDFIDEVATRYFDDAMDAESKVGGTAKVTTVASTDEEDDDDFGG